ncbi:hypothetical protein RJ640_007132 [Escallonia rubra]|uniref:Uncharacterized protein n=1 Tax=Escallonia rubra TaxID=112253 RepID=A0AA88R2I1_9ASTE|nr:hypothetical protein RJ640_007132 [Escallonia rubra]
MVVTVLGSGGEGVGPGGAGADSVRAAGGVGGGDSGERTEVLQVEITEVLQGEVTGMLQGEVTWVLQGGVPGVLQVEIKEVLQGEVTGMLQGGVPGVLQVQNNSGVARGSNRDAARGSNRGVARGRSGGVARGSTSGVASANNRGAARGSTRGAAIGSNMGVASANNRGPWSPEEDAKLKEYIDKYGTGGNWISLPQKAGLRRCGKSCRLRWLNYLRPNIKHGEFSDDEDRIICTLFSSIGSRWSIIAAQLPGRTDNDIKNYWNTKLKKKLMGLMLSSSSSPSCQKIRPQYQATTTYPSISSLLQTPPPLSTSSLSYKFTTNSAYSSSTTTRSFITGYDHDQDHDQTITSIPYSSLLNPTTQNGYVGPMHNYLMFGGIDQAASCSSSDGSCNNNQISHAKEVDQYDQFNYIYNGVNEIQNPKSMLPNGGDLDGLYGENPLDYGLEEIKQLISCSNLNFLS